MKASFIVELEIPKGCIVSEMKQYVKSAVSTWAGSYDPEMAIFDLDVKSVKVKVLDKGQNRNRNQMKILKKSSAMKIKTVLSKEQLQGLKSKYLVGTASPNKEEQKEDRKDYNFNSFLMDVVHAVDYRARSGKDGRWYEFAAMYCITDENYEMILQAMKDCGWKVNMERW